MSRVYLHGFLGAPAAWRAVTECAGDADARCLQVPGHGLAPFTPPGSFEDVVDAVAAQALTDDRTELVGYSLGARVALAIALRHPRRVARVVLVGVSYGLDDARDREARARSDDALARSLERDGVARFVDAWESIPLFDSQRALPPERLAPQRAWRTQHTAKGLAWSLRALGLGQMPSYRAALARSTVPIALVTGARDDKFTAIAREMLRMRSGVAHTVVEGVGHNAVLEAPDAVARVIAGA